MDPLDLNKRTSGSKARKANVKVSAPLKKTIKKYYGFYILLLLPIVYFILFKYVPMVGNVLAFRRYSSSSPLFGKEWVGLLYFKQFLTSADFWEKFRNTIWLSVGTTVFSFPLPIIFALLLNELKNVYFKKIVQTASYLPHFISVIVVVGMIFEILSPNTGIINLIRRSLEQETINFMSEPKWFQTIYISSTIWEGMGWNAIIFIAAIAGIDQELYEASMIDGANRFKQVIHVTLPCINTTIIISLILTIGGIMSVGTEKILLLMNDLNSQTADVIGTYVYRMGLLESNYSYSTAVGLLESVVGLILVGSANYLSRKLTDSSLW